MFQYDIAPTDVAEPPISVMSSRRLIHRLDLAFTSGSAQRARQNERWTACRARY
jgi:hypothetical protein